MHRSRSRFGMALVSGHFLKRYFCCSNAMVLMTTVTLWMILIQVTVATTVADARRDILPTTETHRVARECIEGQCGENQICVEGTCQCRGKNYFFNPILKSCQPRKYENQPCKGYLNECGELLTCINGTCICDDESVFYNPNTQSCAGNFYKDAEVSLLDTIRPVVKGDKVRLLCQTVLVSPGMPDDIGLTWFFNNRTIDANNTKMFEIEDIRETDYLYHHFFNSTLTINRFKKSLTGTYTCKRIRLGKQSRDVATVGHVSITKGMFEEPEVYLEPSYLYIEIERSTPVTVHCHAQQVDSITFIVDGFTAKMGEVYKSKDKFITDSFSFTPQQTSRVQCVGELARDGGNAKVTSNEAIIYLLSQEGVTCPESEDRRGIKWTIAKAPSIVRGDCPKRYTGYSTRECTIKGGWKKTNFTNCLRKDLEEIEEEVEMLEGIDPSEEEIENITSKLSQSMSDPESMLLSDVSQTVDILASVSNTLSKDESDKSLMSTTSLENIADVTNQLLSMNETEWESVDQPEETVSETRKVNRMGAKLLMAMDSLAVASLKQPKISSKPIIKRNIVIKQNQAESNKDIYFPEKSDKIIKELDDWINKSRNAVFLPSEALPINSEKIRYSVLLYRGMRQRISSRDNHSGNTEVQSNIVAFSLNKKIKQLTPGLEMTFGVPTENFSDPVCGFLDTSASELGTWSTEGCRTKQLRSGLVKCTCNHLTNFAVLMSPSRFRNSTHNEVLGIISICGCTISIISLLALIIIYAILWRHMKKDRKTYIHLALSITLLLVYVVFLAGVERSPHEPVCTIIAGVLHYFLLVVFCLMLCEGVEVLMAVLYVFPSSFPVLRLLLPAFGAPLIIVGTTLAITQAKDYRSDDICWLSLSSGTLWAFVVPALVVILVNFVVMCITLHILLGSTAVKGKDNLGKTKMALKSVAVLSPVLGLTWLFGILSINSYTIVFQYLFAICNTLQGFSIFFFYCLSFYQVKDAFRAVRRKQKSALSESATPSVSTSRVRDALNIFRKKGKGSYNVENAAFLSTQAKPLSEDTDQREPVTTSEYDVNPGEPTTTPSSTVTNNVHSEASAETEQESVFMESDALDDKDTKGQM